VIYLDNNATTRIDPEILEGMMPYLNDWYGNAASRGHAMGGRSAAALEFARERMAELLEIKPNELIFTSGATESINLAIKGVAKNYSPKGKHILCVSTEHNAVIDSVNYLAKNGYNVEFIPVFRDGTLNLDSLREAIRNDTILVCCMYVNNETGMIHPIQEIASICSEKGVIFFCDATQAVGKIPILPKKIGIHLLAFSAHKIYGPKGVGGLFISRSVPRLTLSIQMHGGGHEFGFRSGTSNLAGIVGLQLAFEKSLKVMKSDAERIGKLRDTFESELINRIDGVTINGNSIINRIWNVSNLRFDEVLSSKLLIDWYDKLAVSSGSACSSASAEPSHVLLAMGHSKEQVLESVRFSFGRFNTESELDQALDIVMKSVKKQRGL
jgi:cysteine desulfurase